ncbi:hypothetical protein ACTXG6_34425 [Pseudonocardia sp. Cha107L01]|uniref:hypothetical protein n=1 Tax=Pseudonocardia sp. Cha107L01 TaxID=3457576 RepID=UPI00403E56A3
MRDTEAPEPLLPEDAGLGIPVEVTAGDARHPLITVGDSITMGFKSLAITDTSLSWPALLAGALQLAPGVFTYPTYPGPVDCPGLPLNLEALVRGIDSAEAGGLPVIREVRGVHAAIAAVTHVKGYWEHGPGGGVPLGSRAYHHNLAVYGWTVRQAYTETIGQATAAVTEPQGLVSSFSPEVSHASERAMLRALEGPSTGPDSTVTMIDAARAIGADGGIDTLVVALGANNALPSAVQLRLAWSGMDDKPTVWTPSDFAADLGGLRDKVAEINARRVIWATVPHVTIVPIARGMGVKPAGQRYFGRYVHAWVSDAEYLPGVNPALTGEQAWAIDSAIDQYNYTIKKMVYEARVAARPRDWLILDLCGLLDRLAFRRYIADPLTQPSWWAAKAYQLPPVLSALTPQPDTQFFTSDQLGRRKGGLIALDGVHPTTIGYAILAQEVFQILQHLNPDVQGSGIDFAAALAADTLVSHPPSGLADDLRPLHVINSVVDLVQVALGKHTS